MMYKKEAVFLFLLCTAHSNAMFFVRSFNKIRPTYSIKNKKIFKRFNKKIVKRFVDSHSLKHTYDICSYTPLHLVFISPFYGDISNRKKMAKILIEEGAKLNTQDSFGCTPLHRAILYKDLDCIKLLVEAGADIDTKTLRGETPLVMAKRFQMDIDYSDNKEEDWTQIIEYLSSLKPLKLRD